MSEGRKRGESRSRASSNEASIEWFGIGWTGWKRMEYVKGCSARWVGSWLQGELCVDDWCVLVSVMDRVVAFRQHVAIESYPLTARVS